MHDAHSRLWPAFQRLANEYPDCDAVKLTLEMQRWFIRVQQQQFLRQAAATLRQSTSTSVASIANQSAAPQASTAPIENSTAS